jgi:thiol-disulfide isomerase/thioredoxin
MSRIIDTDRKLDEITGSPRGALVLFYAEWCYFSMEFLTVFEKYATDRPDTCFRVITDQLESSEDKYSIDVVPTVLFFRNGRVVKRLDGEPGVGLNEAQLAEMLEACGLAEAK